MSWCTQEASLLAMLCVLVHARSLSDPDVPDASSETEDDEEPGMSGDSSSDSEGQRSPF